MTIKFNPSRLHRRAAPILCLPLLITSVTGLIYRIGKNRFGLSDEAGTWMLRLHDGRVLSDRLAPLYVLLTGVGLVTLLVTGIRLFIQRSRRPRSAASPTGLSFRTLHKLLSPILFLPLLISALTGIIYRVGKAWLGLEDKYVKVFLRIHEGSYLSPKLHLAYVSLIGIGLVALLVTGVPMLGLFGNARAAGPTAKNNE
ncbi:MAG: PepSY domain-containing protein [Phormidesmis sp.]